VATEQRIQRGGLHFVSFQGSHDQLEVVMQRWMQNPRFPADAAGADLLFANGLVTLERGGMFFVPRPTADS
jgi:hypothetical protein